MALNSSIKKGTNGRTLNYLNKDFQSFRQNLIDYTKTYFPRTYSDFNEASPGMLFIEMASYIGDVLGYYIDDSLKESLMVHAEDKDNVISLAQYLGYKPKPTTPALVKLSVYQLVPATGTGGSNTYDTNYFLRINEGMIVETSDGVRFRTTEELDFSVEDEREITVYQRNSTNNEPTFYLVKKYVNAISAELKTLTVDFTTPQEFDSILIGDTNVIDIFDVRDSNGNKWYEVPYLAQEMVFIDYPTTEQTDKDLQQFKDSVPNILKLIKTSKRFVVKVNPDNTTSLLFGGGNAVAADETIIPNFKNVGLGLQSSIDRLGDSFDPANFLKTQTYGEAPANTTLTVSYFVGGGISSNVAAGTLTKIDSISFSEDTIVFTGNELSVYNRMKASVAVENEEPAKGGRGEETVDEIRENALAYFGAQNRAVTRKDYQVRTLAMPPKYGGIAKAYAAPDGELDNNSPASILSNPDSLQQFTDLALDFKEKNLNEEQIKKQLKQFLVGKKSNLSEKNNPFAINLYVLGYDSNKKLTTANLALKENLRTYLNEYRMLTDGINILNGFIINIGVEFDIRVYGGYNKREVLVSCINEISNYFNIDNWTFNMPINISELELLIAGVDGVQSVPRVEIVNKCSGEYSDSSYNISEATKGKLVYPSLDPAVFELKFPNKDIKGRVV